MVDAETYWLAGILEGEGSFFFREAPGRGIYTSRHFTVAMVTVDLDIADRVARLIGGKRNGPYQPRSANGKPYYRVYLYRRQEVLALIRKLQPLMGERRKGQMQAVLDADVKHPVRNPGPKRGGQ